MKSELPGYGGLSYTNPIFRPYTIALGEFALAWNGLHEALALLFCAVMGGGQSKHHLAVWHALKVDRAQRDILLAATKNNQLAVSPPRLMKDIDWICAKANSLEDSRNDALHAPLWVNRRARNRTVKPIIGLGHARAKKLFGKDVLFEYRWGRDSANALSLFAEQLRRALLDGSEPWPDRPQLPNRGDTNGKKQPRPTPSVKRPRRPESSRG